MKFLNCLIIFLSLYLNIHSNDDFVKDYLKSNVFDKHSNRNIKKELLTKILDLKQKDAFKIWHFINNKNSYYELNSEKAIERYIIFKNNINLIKEKNKILTEYKLGIGPDVDLTLEEYKEKYLNKKNNRQLKFLQSNNQINKKSINPDLKKVNLMKINNDLEDWSNYYPLIRQQGNCGSCWAFATTGAIEGFFSKLTKKYEMLSPQFLMDCNNNNKSCDGGFYNYSFNFILEKGLVKEKEYPYIMKNDKCLMPKGDNSFQHIDYLLACSNVIEDNLQYCNNDIDKKSKCENFLKYAPVASSIDAGTFNFQHYSHGIYSSECKDDNHAIIITNITKDFVKIRNSWGESWGEGGYMRVKRNYNNNNSCFTENECYTGVMVYK